MCIVCRDCSSLWQGGLGHTHRALRQLHAGRGVKFEHVLERDGFDGVVMEEQLDANFKFTPAELRYFKRWGGDV